MRSTMRAAARRLAPLLGALLLVSVPGLARAQYRFDVWTVDDGLPQNIITAIHQTRDGYLWVATLDGLAHFDGVRFTIFDKNTTAGIHNNRFTALFEDSRGDLWLGTESSGITRYRQGRFETWTQDHGAPMTFVFGFTEDARGDVIAVTPYALKRWAPDRGRFVDVEAPRFANGYHDLTTARTSRSSST